MPRLCSAVKSLVGRHAFKHVSPEALLARASARILYTAVHGGLFTGWIMDRNMQPACIQLYNDTVSRRYNSSLDRLLYQGGALNGNLLALSLATAGVPRVYCMVMLL